jgi:hypothetical protein
MSSFDIQRLNNMILEKGAKDPFSECCCPKISARQRFTKKIIYLKLRTR